MVIADHSFCGHVNVHVNDSSTQGKRCLVLPIVRDVSSVTPCSIVEKEFYVQLTVHRIVWQ